MNFTTIRRTTALALLLLVLVSTTWIGLSMTSIGYFTTNDWIHAFCLAQTILLAACAVYGPGRFAMRFPLVVAWGLSIGFSLAKGNLISMPEKVSLAAGGILLVAGTLPSLTLFVLHRWRTGATIVRSTASVYKPTPRDHQLSVRMLMVMMTAFAVMAVVARAAITAKPDPFGNEHDKFVMHAWLAFFPCLASTPALFVAFRPSWRIVLAVCFFIILAFVEPLAFSYAAPLIFENKVLGDNLSWEDARQMVGYTLMWHGQALVATVIYALLARAAGLRMIVPNQSNDKNPNPSAQPATDAGCVQD